MGIRALAAVCAVMAVGLIGAAGAQAKAHPRSSLATQAQRAIQDCAEDGFLDRHYTTKALLLAGETLPSDIDQYTNCRWVIERQLLAQNRAAARVISDCTRDGDLDRRYSKSLLRKALLILPSDVDNYTNCRSVINNALHSRARHRR